MGSSARQQARIKTLLDKISKEISSIPKYKGLTVKDSKGKPKQPNPAEAPLVAIGNAITAGRRALRFLKKEPSEKSLVKKGLSRAEFLKKRDKAKKEKDGRPFFNRGGLTTHIDYRKTGLFK